MKGDHPTAKEIRDLIDSLGHGRMVIGEYSDASKEDMDTGLEMVARVLRYALRCRLDEDRAVTRAASKN